MKKIKVKLHTLKKGWLINIPNVSLDRLGLHQ